MRKLNTYAGGEYVESSKLVTLQELGDILNKVISQLCYILHLVQKLVLHNLHRDSSDLI
jgi:hypothetical protein